MQILSRLKHGLPNTLAATVLMALAGLCSGVVLARTLGPAHRGEFAAVLLWSGILALLGELGLGFAFSYYAGKDRGSVSGLWTMAWGTSFAWGGVLALGGAALLPAVLDLSPAVVTSLRWAMVTVPLTLVTLYQSYILLGAGSLTESNLVRVCSTLSYVAGVVVVAAVGWAGVKNYTFAYLLSQGWACLFATGLTRRTLGPSLRWQPALIRPVLGYGLKTFVSSVASQANLRLDQLMMTALASSEQLGLYVVAVAVSGVFGPLYTALAVVVLPRVTHESSLMAGGRQALRHVQLGIIIGFPLTVMAVVAVPWLLPLLFGKDYGQAIAPAQILLVAAIFQGTNTVLGSGLRGLGQPGKTALAESAGLVVTVGLLLALLPGLGAIGAAIASLSAYALVMLVQATFVRRTSGLAWRDFRVVRWRDLLPNIEGFEKLRRGMG
jgi:O-antigen/teichoic acid export membrane protein